MKGALIFAVLPVILLGPAGQSRAEITALVQMYNSPEMNLEEIDRSILDQVGAGGRINFAFYVLSDYTIMDSLRGAAERGAVVRIYLDPRELEKLTLSNDHPLVKLSRTRNLEIKVKGLKDGLMHLKSYSVNGVLLRTGSANESHSGLERQDNDLLVISDKPTVAFLRLPPPILGDIEKLATIVNGDRQRQIIVAGDPENTMKLCAMAGVIDEMTKPPIIERSPKVIVATTPFEALLNVGHLFVDDEGTDRFRFQPIVSEDVILPTSYEGTSGGGLWKFYLAQETFALVQARLIGVVYWQKPVGSELHLVGHGQVSIYDHLLNIIRQKWP
jgi:hypothetical protein